MISTSHNGSYRQTPSLQKNIISDQVSYPPQIENYLDKYQPYKGQSNSTQHLLRAASQNNNSHNYSHQDEINATIGQLTNHGDNLRLINVPYYQSQDQQFRAKGEQYKMFNNCENTRQQGDYN